MPTIVLSELFAGFRQRPHVAARAWHCRWRFEYVCDQLKEINAFVESHVNVSQSAIRAWMASSDIEVLGAVFCIISTARTRNRIRPALPEESAYEFGRDYLMRCLKEDPDGVWALSAHDAGSAICEWVRSLWRHHDGPGGRYTEMKSLLADACRCGDDALRRVLVASCLEHLFEDSAFAHDFEDWREDPQLMGAYEQALEWGSTMGPSPTGAGVGRTGPCPENPPNTAASRLGAARK